MRACVDIGGTKVAVSLSPSSEAPLVGRRSEPTAKTGDNDAVAVQIIRMIEEVCAEQGVDPASIDRVGVSSTGPFELHDGLVELATPNICGGIAGPSRGLPNSWMTAIVEAPLVKRFGSVRVENDAVAALEAEQAEINAALSHPDIFKDYEQAGALQARAEEIELALLEKLERWEMLEAKQSGSA